MTLGDDCNDSDDNSEMIESLYLGASSPAKIFPARESTNQENIVAQYVVAMPQLPQCEQVRAIVA